MRRAVVVVLLSVAIVSFGCGGANPEPGVKAGGAGGGRAQIAGPAGPGKPRVAGGSSSLEEAEYQLARHAADIVAIMRDHMGDCDRAARVCGAYVDRNRASIEDAKAHIVAAIESGPPDREDEIERDLQHLLLEMEPRFEQVAEDFEDSCRGVADEIGEVFDF